MAMPINLADYGIDDVLIDEMATSLPEGFVRTVASLGDARRKPAWDDVDAEESATIAYATRQVPERDLGQAHAERDQGLSELLERSDSRFPEIWREFQMALDHFGGGTSGEAWEKLVSCVNEFVATPSMSRHLQSDVFFAALAHRGFLTESEHLIFQTIPDRRECAYMLLLLRGRIIDQGDLERAWRVTAKIESLKDWLAHRVSIYAHCLRKNELHEAFRWLFGASGEIDLVLRELLALLRLRFAPPIIADPDRCQRLLNAMVHEDRISADLDAGFMERRGFSDGTDAELVTVMRGLVQDLIGGSMKR
jgi:hypothetical protein